MSRRLVEPPQPRRRQVSAEELRLWRQVVKESKPLPGRSVPDEPLHSGPEPVASPPPPPGPPPLRPSADRPPPKPGRSLDPLWHGHTPGLDRRSAKRMSRGEMEIEATIDLHGQTQEAAHATLIGFIQRAWGQGLRMVLVVTGKGNQGVGILKAQVPRWLNQTPLRERILGFSHARLQHGGDGALYVLLKRHRA
jgi:DNA-nicking Smr family endonuclease